MLYPAGTASATPTLLRLISPFSARATGDVCMPQGGFNSVYYPLFTFKSTFNFLNARKDPYVINI